MSPPNIIGIDYGSKLAGTTVIAFFNAEHCVEFAASIKNQDADQFILEWVSTFQPQQIFLDAPLSLPGVYRELPGYTDFFYRQADRAVRAMSPMFLGGLTARAMQLTNQLTQQGIKVLETYPGHLADALQWDRQTYKKQAEHLPQLSQRLAERFRLKLAVTPPTWHHLDALLALTSGLRYHRLEHLTFGDPEEGLILV